MARLPFRMHRRHQLPGKATIPHSPRHRVDDLLHGQRLPCRVIKHELVIGNQGHFTLQSLLFDCFFIQISLCLAYLIHSLFFIFLSGHYFSPLVYDISLLILCKYSLAHLIG